MSGSNPNHHNARRQHQYQHHQHQPNHHSGLRRSHLYSNRGSTFLSADAGAEPVSQLRAASYSRIDGAGPGFANPSQDLLTDQSTTTTAAATNTAPNTTAATTTTTTTTTALPTAGEYFARETATAPVGRSRSPVAPWARTSSRFSTQQARSVHANSSYGLPPTPESDVSVSRIATPPRQPRDYQFNVDMMQRMTQHAKISPLNQYDYLKRELAEDNLVVDGGNVDRLVARAGERMAGSTRGHDSAGAGAGAGAGPSSGEHYASRRVAFRSPEAVEGAREASRRLNGASGTIDRAGGGMLMYDVAPKPAEPIPSSNMYDELKRTLSESSSERPKRVVRPAAGTRQLPPLSPVQKRHVEIRPRRPVVAAGAATAPTSHAPSPTQRNGYYQQDARPRTAPAHEDPITNVDWLAAAQTIGDTSSSQRPSSSGNRRRPRTLSSGTPLGKSVWSARQDDEFGGELRPASRDTHSARERRDSHSHSHSRSHSHGDSFQGGGAQNLSRPASQPAAAGQLPTALSNSYLKHNLADFVSEDDLTLDLSYENNPPATLQSGLRSAGKRPATSGGAKPQEVSFLKSTRQTDPDETLDTLRQLSRLLSSGTPTKSDSRDMSADTVLTPSKPPTSADTRQPYKRQSRPISQTPKTGQRTTLTSVLNQIAQKNKAGSSSAANRSTDTPAKALGSQTTTSKTIQFEDGYETDDSLDRLLVNDTDYGSLLKPAAFEDESFLQGTVQVAKQPRGAKASDLETLALRAKVLSNLQTVQLDIRETRRGIESIERRFGMVEDDERFRAAAAAAAAPTSAAAGEKPAVVSKRYVLAPRKRHSSGKGLLRWPWGIKDFLLAVFLLVVGLVAIEYKMWSDTIIPQYSRVSSDEWFAKHPVGSYRPGGTFRAIFQVGMWIGNLGWVVVQQVFAVLLWVLSGIQWLEFRVMEAVSPLPPEFQFAASEMPAALPGSTCASAEGMATPLPL